MMKKTFSIIFIFILIINIHAQIKNSISEIERTVLKINKNENLTIHQVPSNEIAKVEKYWQDENIKVFKKENQTVKIVDYSKYNGGGYEQTIIYIQNEKPILIEKEVHRIIKARYSNRVEVSNYVQKSKLFFFNWDKNIFEHYFWNKNNEDYKKSTQDDEKTVLAIEIPEISRILKLSKSATITISE